MKTVTLEVPDDLPEDCAWVWIAPDMDCGIIEHPFDRSALQFVPPQNVIALCLMGTWKSNPQLIAEWMTKRKKELGLEHEPANC